MDLLRDVLVRHVERRPAWLTAALAGSPITPGALSAALGAAPAELGRTRLALLDHEIDAAGEAGVRWAAQSTVDEIARVLLIRVAVSTTAQDPVALVRSLYKTGDNRERAAVLRALPLLPDPPSFVPIATEGCRTNVKPVFEAIACESAYPARFFPDAAFHQMVLKALFVGTPLARIDGLRDRTSDELRRMARSYASERAAAGRTIPSDIHALLASEAGGGATP